MAAITVKRADCREKSLRAVSRVLNPRAACGPIHFCNCVAFLMQSVAMIAVSNCSAL
jgi:hypothetical protein